jgi:transcriptional regulator with XRE-family HTH domain
VASYGGIFGKLAGPWITIYKLTKVDGGYTLSIDMAERKLNVKNIKNAMDSLGINQAELAKLLEVSRESVSNWLSEEKFPRASKLLEMSKNLKLGFSEMVIQELSPKPIVAFRTNKNKRISTEKEINADDTGHMLRILLPYLDKTVFSAPFAQAPSLDYDYIQKVASEVRKRVKVGSSAIDISHIMELYDDFHIVLIPVLWGEKGDNGLYIKLPEDEITFIYANIEKFITDFKFWLLHELAHAMTTDLDGENAELFADHLAAAVLFPGVKAKEVYHELEKIRITGAKINRIKEIAMAYLISPYTVLNEVNTYARFASISPLEIAIGGAVTNFNKSVGLLSNHLFKGVFPSPEEYIKICQDSFKSKFFVALAGYLQETGADAGVVHRLMNIPIADAKGVYKILVNKNDFT